MPFGLVATAIMVVIGLVLVFAAGSAFGALLINAAPVLPVLAIGVAMLRYRLYDIDLVIRRTLVYTMITAVRWITELNDLIFGEKIIWFQAQRSKAKLVERRNSLGRVLSVLRLSRAMNDSRSWLILLT